MDAIARAAKSYQYVGLILNNHTERGDIVNKLPNLPLIQERFFNSILSDLIQNNIRHPEFEVINVFSQTWGSTALGFGDIGGQAITTAYTTIIENVDLGYVAVFFGEHMAYIIKHPNEKFVEDVKKRNMCSVSNCSKYENQTFKEND